MKANQIKALASELEELNQRKGQLNNILQNFLTPTTSGTGFSSYGRVIIKSPSSDHNFTYISHPNTLMESLLNSEIAVCLKRIAEIEAM